MHDYGTPLRQAYLRDPAYHRHLRTERLIRRLGTLLVVAYVALAILKK